MINIKDLAEVLYKVDTAQNAGHYVSLLFGDVTVVRILTKDAVEEKMEEFHIPFKGEFQDDKKAEDGYIRCMSRLNQLIDWEGGKSDE